jgi:hypothetical protein
MSKKSSLQVAALQRARDLAGGVSYLARKLGIGANSLDDMLHDKEPVPSWVFLRAVDFINEAETSGKTPPGLPEDWQEQWLDDSSKH